MDSPSREHVVVRRAHPVKLAHVFQEAGGAAEEHRRCALLQAAYLMRARVLLASSVTEVAEEHASDSTQERKTARRT
jgi:hypothetical protein